MLPNQKGVNLYSLPISVSDNIWCEAVEKLGLLKKLISAKHQFACNYTTSLHAVCTVQSLLCMQLMYTKAFSHHSKSTAASHTKARALTKVLHKSLSYREGVRCWGHSLQ